MNNTERANAAAKEISLKLTNAPNLDGDRFIYWGSIKCAEKIAEIILKNFPNDGWIPVSERLPEPSSLTPDCDAPIYLVSGPCGAEVSAWYEGQFETSSEVTHWKEIGTLPAPPKEGAVKWSGGTQ